MINPDQLKKKAERQYEKVLRSYLTGDSLFPMDFPVGTIPKDYLELRDAVTHLIDKSKIRSTCGYHIDLESRKTQKYGTQSLPKRIYFQTRLEYLKFIQREKEFIQYQSDVTLIMKIVPQLEDWLIGHPLMVVEYSDIWPDLLKVCQYFQNNPQPNLYIRELPIAVHTKFIEQNKRILRNLLEFLIPNDKLKLIGEEKEYEFEQRFSLRYREPTIRFRILDPFLVIQNHLPATDITIPISDFENLNLTVRYCLITENLMNFLTLPPIEFGIAIFGGGYGVTVIKSTPWLSNCPIFYWGDLDPDGFKILSALRRYFPQVTSLMMDRETLVTFNQFIVSISSRDKESNLPSDLTPEEQSLYIELLSQGKRLEQERVSHLYLMQQLASHNIPLLTKANS